MVKVGDHYYEPYYIPIKIFKAITAGASYGFMCEYGTGVYIGIKYVSNTSVKLTVSGTLTMYVYGIK